MMTELMILGTRKGLLLFEQHGGEWRFCREEFKAQPVSYATLDPRTGTLWAALDHGHWGTKLQRSEDVGATWREIPAPKYPDDAFINTGFPGEEQKPKPATLSYIWLIAPGGADQPKRIYIGTEPGGLFQSDDGGETWQLNEGLWNRPERLSWWFGGGRDYPGLCSLCIDPRDSNHLFVGISVGGVYESRDGGATWEGRNKGLLANYMPDPYPEYGHDPHFMQMSPSDPDILWQQNHCGIFRTVDSAQTWKDISQPGGPAYFGFPIALDEKDPETAWVVPAIDAEFRIAVDQALCVCRTEDGGQSWQELRNGLPQANAYDVVFRHALDIKGDRLAFGTTTGNLYMSDDRGDSWRSLGSNFPPVYSVRFATT
jgi:photosystem II stability/assembly factor-like uncharacterized protein